MHPVVVGLGELLWDCFADSRHPGGAPANFAFHAQQLGCRGIVCSRVGEDELGKDLIEFLRQQGLETEFIQRDGNHATGRVTVDTSQEECPQYTIHEDVAWDCLECDHRTEALMQQADAVCFGTLAQRSVISREAILQCLMATSDDCRIVYDINLRQHWYDRVWIERSMQMADLVKLNEDEARTVSDLLGWEFRSLHTFANAVMQQFAVDLVCITQAEHGCFVANRMESADVPGIPIDVADAVGAGDAFTAALIYTQLKDWPLFQAAEFGNRIGAIVASHPGGMPLLSKEFDELKAEYIRS